MENVDIESTLRKNIKYLRKKYHITQTQMAEILGINTKSTICDLEKSIKTKNGIYRGFNVKQLIALVQYFNISSDKLLFTELEKEDNLL